MKLKQLPNGYVEIPGYPGYGIHREDLSLFNFNTNNPIEPAASRGNEKGTYFIMTVYLPDGKKTTLARHRASALCWVPRDDETKNVVNHINGIPGDDRPENLEWVTVSENNRHAALTGLTGLSLEIDVMDSLTGEVARYETLTQAANALNMGITTVWRRASFPHERVWPELKQYRLVREYGEREWPCFKNPREEIGQDWTGKEITFDWKKKYSRTGEKKRLLEERKTGNVVEVKDILTGKVYEFNSIVAATRAFGTSETEINRFINDETQPMYTDYRIYRWRRNGPEWPIIEDPYLEYMKNFQARIVVCVNMDTLTAKLYLKAVDCAKDAGLKANTLNWRLKDYQKKVEQGKPFTIHPDGCVYMYYTDYVKFACRHKTSLIAGSPLESREPNIV